MSKRFYSKHFSLAYVRCLNIERVLFQGIQFSISTQFSSIWPIDRILLEATTPVQSRPMINGNEGVLRIPQSSSISGSSPSNCLVSNLGHSLRSVLPLCREAVPVCIAVKSCRNQSLFALVYYLYFRLAESTIPLLINFHPYIDNNSK